MKKLVLISALALSVFAREANAATVDVYLFGGQSNMLGRAEYPYSALTRDGLISFYYEIGRSSRRPKDYDMTQDEAPVGGRPNLPRWLQTVPREPGSLSPQLILGHYRTGPEIQFGREAFALNRNVAIVKFAYGSTRLNGQWVHSDSVDLADRMIMFFSQVIQNLIDRGDTPVIKSYTHAQGESDTFSADWANSYYDNLKQVLAKVRAFSKYSKLPIAIVRIHPDYSFITPAEATVLRPKADAVRAAQTRLASEDSCTALVNTDDLTHFTLWHFADPYQLGKRNFAMLRPLITTTTCYGQNSTRRAGRGLASLTRLFAANVWTCILQRRAGLLRRCAPRNDGDVRMHPCSLRPGVAVA